MTANRIHEAYESEVRSIPHLLVGLLVAGGLCLLPMIPAVRDVLHVGVLDVVIAMTVFAALSIAGTIIHYRVPSEAPVRQVFDRIETVGIQLAVLSLVVASARGDSFFWFAWVAHAAVTGTSVASARFNRVVFTVMPGLVALTFAVVHGDLGASALAVLIGVIGVQIFALSARATRRIEAADAERARLAAALAEERVHRERARIARDIHDGIGTDLAALDWRLRSLQAPGVSSADIDALVERLAHGARELRGIVWALRAPERTWSDAVDHLRQRGRELCGDALTFELDVSVPSEAMVGERGLELIRSILELVYNARRHAGAARVRVELVATPDELRATVEDDGSGISASALGRSEGGLANVRARITRLAGTCEVSLEGEAGTRFALSMPSR